MIKRAMTVVVVALGLLALNACHDARLTNEARWYVDVDDCAYMEATLRMNAGPSWGANNYVEGRNRFYYPADDCAYPHDHGAGTIGNLVWFMRADGTVCQAGPGWGHNAATNYQLITTWYPQATWGSCNDE